MKVKLTILLIIGLALTFHLPAQHIEPSTRALSPKYLEQVGERAGRLEQKMDKQTAKALQQWQKQENKIKRRLSKLDSVKALEIFGNPDEKYKQLEQKLQGKLTGKQFIPSMDTLSTSLKFLEQNPQLLSNVKGAKEKLRKTMSEVSGLQGQFQKAEEVKRFLKERKGLLKEKLGNLTFAKELNKLNKTSYYYSQQLSEYKTLLKDHKKAERKALETLSRTKTFKDFMRKNSMLSSMFRLPDNHGDEAGLVGLQTRAQVNGLIQQQIAAGGTNARQQLSQNLQAAQSQLTQLKDKMMKLGNSGSDEEMPEGFKPNTQKTKSFLKRLEFGTNIQSQKANGFFPVTSDIGLSVGYKLNDRSIIGVGSSYKLGLGQNIRHINITHQGLSIRSFADWKIKGSFWFSGGYEMNYRSEFKNVEQLKMLNGWQKSGLVGVSKILSLKTKFFKKTKIGLLWDFLSNQQTPRQQPILFRVGYNFK